MLLQNSIPSEPGRLAAPGALLILLLTLLLLAGDRMSALESAFYDFLQQHYPATPSTNIVLVDTSNNASSSQFWDTEQFSFIFDTLNKAGAALIVPMEVPPTNSTLPDIKQLTALAELEKRASQYGESDTTSLNKQLALLRAKQEQQQAIANAISDAGNIVLPIMTRPTKQALEDAKAECREHTITGPGAASEAQLRIRETAETLSLPDFICNGAASVGHYAYWPDMDGVVRRDHLLVKSGKRVFPSLALAVAQSYKDNERLSVPTSRKLTINDQPVLTGDEYSRLIRFYPDDPEHPAFRIIQAEDIRSPEQARDLFSDNIVLVGDLSNGLPGNFKTPLNNSIPASLLIATTLSNLLQSDFISRPEWFSSLEMVALGVIALAILLSAPLFSANRAVVVTVLFCSILLTLEAYFLMTYGVWLQLVTAAIFSVLGICSIQTLTALRPRDLHLKTAVTATAPATPLSNEQELDLEFSVLRQQPPTDETKKRLYNIAMAHGKKREFAKAERVLAHIYSLDPDFHDVRKKLEALSGALKKSEAEKVDVPAEKKDHLPASQMLSKKKPDAKRTLGRYIIEKVIGKGAMATVYLGLDPKINRQVAIKTIALAEEFSDEDLQAAKDQFLREAESAGRLNHPSIITIFDTGEDHNVAYLAMEYFPGKALNTFTSKTNLLPVKWVLELMARGAEALHYAHGQGVVHRDIKPANLMYDAPSDEFRITDFGIARLTDTSRTKTGIILGTPSYMSPEQLVASNVTGSSDLYSLGVTMYQLLTGTTPFRSDSIPQLMDKIIHDKHTPLSKVRDDLPAELDVIMGKILAKKPEDRYQNGRAMALALRDCSNRLES